MRTLALVLAIPALWVGRHSVADTTAVRAAAPDPDVTEWKVPWERTRPRDPYVDQQGRVWFTGQEGNYIAYLDQKSGEFKRFDLEPSTNAHNVVVDKQGNVWYTGNRNGRLGRMDPRTGKVTTYLMPDSTIRDPHTMIFDQKGDVWFTAQFANVVGRLTMATGKIELVKMPTARARPYGIVIDSKGRPWFDEFGTNRIGMIDPATMELKEFTLPEGALPRRIAITSDDVIWYGDYRRGMLGRLDPTSGAVKEFPLPGGGGSLPYGMATDHKDRIWVAETNPRVPNALVVFDPKTEQVVSTKTVAGAPNTIRHMYFHPADKTLWYGSDLGMIGRVRVMD